MKTYNILFLCTHNSARSILAEAVASTQTGGRLIGFSAGSTPQTVSGRPVHPIARDLAIELGYPAEKLRSKSWDEFALPDAPQMDVIITVCDNAAGEVCPVWIGKPVTAHWGFPDPSHVSGSDTDKIKAFRDVMHGMKARIQTLASLPLEEWDQASIQANINALAP